MPDVSGKFMTDSVCSVKVEPVRPDGNACFVVEEATLPGRGAAKRIGSSLRGSNSCRLLLAPPAAALANPARPDSNSPSSPSPSAPALLRRRPPAAPDDFVRPLKSVCKLSSDS